MKKTLTASIFFSFCVLSFTGQNDNGILTQKAIRCYFQAEYDSSVFYLRKFFNLSKSQGELQSKKWEYIRYFSRSLSRVGEVDEAKKFLLSLAHTINDMNDLNDLYLAQYLDEWGILHLNHLDPSKSRKFFEQSLSIKINCQKYDLGIDTMVADSYSYLGEVSFQERDFIGAKDLFLKALSLRQAHFPANHYTFPLIFTQLGLSEYYLHQYRSSTEYFEKSLALFVELYGREHPGTMIAYNNLSNALYYTGHWEKARYYLDSAIMIAKNTGKNENLFSYYINLAQFANFDGEYEKALLICKDAQALIQNGRSISQIDLANFYDLVGGLYQNMGYYGPSNDYFEKGKNIKLQTVGIDSRPYVQYLFNVSTNLAYQKDYWRAAQMYQEGLDILKKIGLESDILYPNSLSMLAKCKLNCGYFVEAEVLYSKSHKIYEVFYGEHFPETIAEEFKWVHLRAKRLSPGQAYGAYRKLILKSSPDWNPDNKFSLPPVGYLRHQFISMGLMFESSISLLEWYKIVKDRELLEAAIDHIDLGIAYYDNRYSEVGGFKGKEELIETAARLYALGVDLSVILFSDTQDDRWLSKAAYYGDRSKNTRLRESWKMIQGIKFSDVPDSLIQLERHLERQIHRFYLLASEGIVSEESEQDLQRSKIQYDQLKEHFRMAYPKYFEIRHSIETIRLETVRENIVENELILLILKGIDQYYCLAASRDSAYIKPVMAHNGIGECMAELFSAMYQEDAFRFARVSNYIYRSLFDSDLSIPHRIIWLPDGAYSLLNPELLVTQISESDINHSFDSLKYFIYETSISFSDGLDRIRQERQDSTYRYCKNLSIIAPFDKSSYEDHCYAEKVRFNRLPWSEKIAQKCAKIYRGTFLIGKNAHKSAVLKAMESGDIVFFATHGLMDWQIPLKSSLILSCSHKAEGNLTLLDLYGEPIQADLVILSACNSGDGRFLDGEGVASIARGFKYAGAESVAMALWSIDEESTLKIIEDWFSFLSIRSRCGDGLRQAKLKYLSDQQHSLANPLYWAGLVFSGQNHIVEMPVKLSASEGWILLSSLMIGVVIFLLLSGIFKKLIFSNRWAGKH